MKSSRKQHALRNNQMVGTPFVCSTRLGFTALVIVIFVYVYFSMNWNLLSSIVPNTNIMILDEEEADFIAKPVDTDPLIEDLKSLFRRFGWCCMLTFINIYSNT